MRRAVVLAGGWAHPGQDQVEAVSALLAPRSVQVQVVTNPDDVPAALANGCDLLVVAACWFSMADDRYSDEQRRHHAVPLTDALRDSLAELRDRGCPVLALHTAVICFDSHDIWADWLGGAWNWDTSWHPTPAPVVVEPLPGSAIDCPPFTVTDELYQGLDMADDVQLVAHSHGHPLVWVRQHEQGRVAVNLLGHDARSLTNPSHQRLNEQLLGWLLPDPG